MTITDLQGLKVKVYYNLHKHCLSVQHRGKVVAHVQHITLSDVHFRVNEAGRQRVLRTNQKNVHAFIIGVVSQSVDCSTYTNIEVAYNPRLYKQFINRVTKEEIYGASCVLVEDKKIYAIGDLLYA